RYPYQESPVMKTEEAVVADVHDGPRGMGAGLQAAESRLNFALYLLLALVFIGALMASFTLLAGDLNFWTDWKDRVYWPLITAAAVVPTLAAAQYIGWR